MSRRRIEVHQFDTMRGTSCTGFKKAVLARTSFSASHVQRGGVFMTLSRLMLWQMCPLGVQSHVKHL